MNELYHEASSLLNVCACGPIVQIDGGEVKQRFSLVDLGALLQMIEPPGEVEVVFLVHGGEGFLQENNCTIYRRVYFEIN